MPVGENDLEEEDDPYLSDDDGYDDVPEEEDGAMYDSDEGSE